MEKFCKVQIIACPLRSFDIVMQTSILPATVQFHVFCRYPCSLGNQPVAAPPPGNLRQLPGLTSGNSIKSFYEEMASTLHGKILYVFSPNIHCQVQQAGWLRHWNQFNRLHSPLGEWHHIDNTLKGRCLCCNVSPISGETKIQKQSIHQIL